MDKPTTYELWCGPAGPFVLNACWWCKGEPFFDATNMITCHDCDTSIVVDENMPPDMTASIWNAAWNRRAPVPWTVTELKAWSVLSEYAADRHPDNISTMTVENVIEALGGKVEG